MTTADAPPRRLVLVGGGHAHAQVLERWTRDPLPDVDLWLVSPDARSPYSGMVPGWLAGLYAYDDICIDVAALCAKAGATFLQDEMTGLDATRRQVRLRGGAWIGYDLLSLDVGSTLHPPSIAGATVLPLRPLSQLRGRWDGLLADLARGRTDAAITITGVGGGAAGFESVVALHHRLRTRPHLRASLVTTGDTVVAGLARGAVRRASRLLADRGIALRARHAFAAADLSGDARHVVLWATGARPHAWQQSTALATDADGYFVVDRHLRSISHPDVYACGDCAAWSRPLPKSGVHAVRMGPILANNLRAALGHGRPRAYRPQRRHLVLLSTADRRAIASRGAFSFSGAWVWRWKDWIDRRFVDRFLDRFVHRTVSPATEESP